MERPEIQEIFTKYSSKDGRLEAAGLMQFLQKEQGEQEMSLERCQDIIEKFESCTNKDSFTQVGSSINSVHPQAETSGSYCIV